MTESELLEQIKLEEDTLCCLPFEPQYKTRRIRLTRLAALHRALLVDSACSDDSWGGHGGAARDGRAHWRSGEMYGVHDHYRSLGSPSGGEVDEVKVLVAESEPVVALLLRLVLENRGFSVRVVETRAAAVAECGRWTPDVMVTDLPRTDLASAEFIAEVQAEAGAGGLRIVGTGSPTLRVPSIDALIVRPFEAEDVAEKVSALSGEMTNRPADKVCRS